MGDGPLRRLPATGRAAAPGHRPAPGGALAGGEADGTRPLRELFAARGGVPARDELRDLRIRLTTPSFPHLRAVTQGG